MKIKSKYVLYLCLRWVENSTAWQGPEHSNVLQAHLRRTVFSNRNTTVGSLKQFHEITNTQRARKFKKSPGKKLMKQINQIFFS